MQRSAIIITLACWSSKYAMGALQNAFEICIIYATVCKVSWFILCSVYNTLHPCVYRLFYTLIVLHVAITGFIFSIFILFLRGWAILNCCLLGTRNQWDVTVCSYSFNKQICRVGNLNFFIQFQNSNKHTSEHHFPWTVCA